MRHVATTCVLLPSTQEVSGSLRPWGAGVNTSCPGDSQNNRQVVTRRAVINSHDYYIPNQQQYHLGNEVQVGLDRGIGPHAAVSALFCLVERETGLEPAALCLGSKCATIAPLP